MVPIIKKNIYLGSTLDLLEVHDAIRQILEDCGFQMTSETAASLEGRMDAESISKNVLRSDAVILLINGTDPNSQFVKFDKSKYDSVEAEYEITKSLKKDYHVFVPAGKWEKRILSDVTFAGKLRYCLRNKVELDKNCTLCGSPSDLPYLIIKFLLKTLLPEVDNN